MAFTKYPITDYNNLNVDWMVDKLRENTDNIDLNAAGLTAETEAREAADAALQAQIDTLDPEGIRNAVSISARSVPGTVVCIGDSYLAGWTPDGDVTDWGTLLCSYLGKTMGTDFFRYAEGGSGFAYVGSGGNTFLTLLQAAVSSGDFEAENVKYLIVGGGFNDHYKTYDEIKTASDAFCNWAANNLPNARVCIANMGYGDNYTAAQYMAVSSAYALHDQNAVFLGDVQTVLRASDTMASDSRHPNAYGQRKLAEAVLSSLMTGDYTGDQYSVQPTVLASGVSLMWWVKDHIFHLMLQQKIGAGVSLSGLSGSADGSRPAQKLDILPFNIGTGNFYTTSANCLTNHSKFTHDYYNVVLAADGIEFRPLVLNDAGNGWVNLSNITEYMPGGFLMVIPFAFL